MKMCSKCKEIKEFSLFYRRAPSKDGYQSACKSCCAHTSKEWAKANPKSSKESSERWRDSNREAIATRSREYREANAEAVAAAQKAWRDNNREYNRERKRVWNKSHRSNVKKTLQKWREANRETVRIQNDNHRALKLNAIGTHTEAEWTAMCDYYGHKCLKCEAFVEVLTRDHVIPLSRGGNNCIHNIQPLCRSHNSEKHAKTADYRFGIYAQPSCQCS